MQRRRRLVVVVVPAVLGGPGGGGRRGAGVVRAQEGVERRVASGRRRDEQRRHEGGEEGRQQNGARSLHGSHGRMTAAGARAQLTESQAWPRVAPTTRGLRRASLAHCAHAPPGELANLTHRVNFELASAKENEYERREVQF